MKHHFIHLFYFCTCTCVFTSLWYSQEQFVVLRVSLSSVSFHLCTGASSDPPGLPVILLLSFPKHFFQSCSSFPRSLVLFPVLMKCWPGEKAEIVWIPQLSNKLPPSTPTFLQPSLVTVYLSILEGVELSCFACISWIPPHFWKESQSLLLHLCLSSCWLLIYSQAGETERCSLLKILLEAGASLWHPLSRLNYCEDGFIELHCQITTAGSADKDFIAQKFL